MTRTGALTASGLHPMTQTSTVTVPSFSYDTLAAHNAISISLHCVQLHCVHHHRSSIRYDVKQEAVSLTSNFCQIHTTSPTNRRSTAGPCTVKRGNIVRFWDILCCAAVPVRDMNYVDICL